MVSRETVVDNGAPVVVVVVGSSVVVDAFLSQSTYFQINKIIKCFKFDFGFLITNFN